MLTAALHSRYVTHHWGEAEHGIRRESSCLRPLVAAHFIAYPRSVAFRVLSLLLDRTRGEKTHRWPWFLPDGRHFVYSADTVGGTASAIRVASIDSQAGDSRGAIPGLWWRRFLTQSTPKGTCSSWARRHLGGPAVRPEAPDHDLRSRSRRGKRSKHRSAETRCFSVSGNGALVYLSGGRQITRLAWFDRSGKQVATLGDPGGLI